MLPLIGCISCNNNLTTIGQDLIFNGNNIELKAFRLNATGTVKLDSFATSSGRYGQPIMEMYAGKFTDPYSGQTEASPCFQIVPSYQPSIPIYYDLDSVTFHFTYGGKIWGDTLNRKLQTFELCQLADLPELDTDDNNLFYNTSPIAWGPSLGTVQFLPKVTQMKQAYFKLDEKSALMQDIWQKMKYGDDIFRPNSGGPVAFYKFMKYFKGLAIRGIDETSCLLAIQANPDSLYMRFHYHKGDNDGHFDLKLLTQTREFQYNQIRNTPPPALAALKKQEDEVRFTESKFALIQGLSGYMTKIVLPQPEALDAYSVVIKAEIEIKPYVWSGDPVSMPNSINVYETNPINEIKGYLYNSLPSGSAEGSAVTGIYQPNREDPNSSKYIFDITGYYQRISSTPPVEDQAYQMLLSIPNLTSSFNRAVLKELPLLKVYYANYN